MFAVLLMRATGRAARPAEAPLELLRRRYSVSQIDAHEYEKHKATLERDAHQVK